MNFEDKIRRAVKAACPAFARTTEAFSLTFGVNPYPERTISYYYVAALKEALKPANVLLEIPVAGLRVGRHDNHIDALVFNDRCAVMAEFKRVWTPDHWEWLADDLKRLKTRACREISERFTDKRKRRCFIFLGADCWRLEVAQVWKTGIKTEKWKLPPVLLAGNRGYSTVWRETGKDYDGYYFTWALLPA